MPLNVKIVCLLMFLNLNGSFEWMNEWINVEIIILHGNVHLIWNWNLISNRDVHVSDLVLYELSKNIVNFFFKCNSIFLKFQSYYL